MFCKMTNENVPFFRHFSGVVLGSSSKRTDSYSVSYLTDKKVDIIAKIF